VGAIHTEAALPLLKLLGVRFSEGPTIDSSSVLRLFLPSSPPPPPPLRRAAPLSWTTLRRGGIDPGARGHRFPTAIPSPDIALSLSERVTEVTDQSRFHAVTNLRIHARVRLNDGIHVPRNLEQPNPVSPLTAIYAATDSPVIIAPLALFHLRAYTIEQMTNDRLA
jgi:hypothetical protein